MKKIIRRILIRVLSKTILRLSALISKVQVIGRTEENDIMENNNTPEIHKVVSMNVDMKENLVTMLTEAKDKKVQHSMTVERAYERGLIDYINMNRVIV